MSVPDRQAGSGPAREPCGVDDQQEPSPSSEPGILDEILLETARSRLIAEGADDSGVQEVLCRVARRHLGARPELKPVVVELVGAVLAHRIDPARSECGQWQAMVEAVAATLHDDPPSRDRLHRLWAELQRVVTCR